MRGMCRPLRVIAVRARPSNSDRKKDWIASSLALLAMTGEGATLQLPICPSRRPVAVMTQETRKQPAKAAREERHVDFTASAGHCGAIHRARRAVAVANAGRNPPRSSVSDLDAVRGAGAELDLRRISRARRRARRGSRRARSEPRRIRADPPGHL